MTPEEYSPPTASIDTGEEVSTVLLSAGSQLGPYEIRALVGRGGMGQVYKAFDPRLGRDVAIKVGAERFSSRFDREARAVAALNHPNICSIFDVGPNYLVMELVEGETLRASLLRGLPLDRSLAIARQVLAALCAAHRAGVVHRDLKPENIMVRADGYVKVLDFGLAKRLPAATRAQEAGSSVSVSQPGRVVGTFSYMSPEQIQGREVDPRSDLFAFGIILYEMLTQRHPWLRPSTLETLHAILHEDPPAANDSLDSFLLRCLAKKPDGRFPSAVEAQAALEHAAADVPAKPAARQPSIAVLPFTNMSGDKENEYFGDGLAEEVIHALANLPGIKVSGRTSSFFFRGKDVELGEIGRRLNVEHILEGSVRRSGNRMRVTAQLIEAGKGFHLWSQRYEREVTDIFAVQDEITQAIAQALQVTLRPGPAAAHRYPNLRAYEHYVKARNCWFTGPAGLEPLKTSVEKAIELDPEFAPAYFLLGAYYSMAMSFGMHAAHEALPMARAAEQQALRLDPSMAEANGLLACCATYEYDWTGAERLWRLALARQPEALSAVKASDIRFWYGNHYLMPIGRPAEALQAMTPGLEEDPLNSLYRHHYARCLRHAGRLQEAEAELRKLLEPDDPFPLAAGTLGAICAQQGRMDAALEFSEKSLHMMPWSYEMMGQVAGLLSLTGESGPADELVAKLGSGEAYTAPVGLALFHSIRGDFEKAAEWAARAAEQQYPGVVGVLGPWLRPTPQWPALAKRMNLPG